MQQLGTLFNREFLALNALLFLTFCNLALFFQFYEYLGSLPIPRDDFGFIIAVFSLVVLIIRPIISPLLTPENSKRWITISAILMVISLLLYFVADGYWSMVLVRVFHGGAYVVLATAALCQLMECIPPDRSGQAFGLISVITSVVPYAIIPPIITPLSRLLGGFREVLGLSALVMVFSLWLLWYIPGNPRKSPARGQRMTFQDIIHNLKDPGVLILLFLSLAVWTTFTPVFYFLKGYGDKIGISNPGLFFTVSTSMEVAVRVVAGRFLDKYNKGFMLAASLAVIGAGFISMADVVSVTAFFSAAVVMGLGWGVAMPLLNGVMFEISEPNFRSLNSNLNMEMFQAGFFLGPLIGDVILRSWGYGVLFYGCGAVMLAGGIAALKLAGSRAHL
jgi:predicted MFS family arabinose efflux permease